MRWCARLADLAQWIWEEFGISLSETTVGREVTALGFAKISARPRHYAQNEPAIDDFKNVWPAPSATYGPPRLQADFFDAAISVCANVSGIGALLPAQMELRATRS